MGSHSSPPTCNRPRQDLQSPGSAPARKTPHKIPRRDSEITTTSSSTSHVDNDTTMEDADASVLFESSACAPPPQHHHTHSVTGTRPTKSELFETAERAQTLATSFNTGRASTPPSQATNHWISTPNAPDSRMSGCTVVKTDDAFLRHVGAHNSSPVRSPNCGRRPSTDDDDVLSSSSRSSRVEMSPKHHHARDTSRSDESQGTFCTQRLAPSVCHQDQFAISLDTHRPVGRGSLTLPQAQCISAAKATSTLETAALGLASDGSDGSALGASFHPPDFGPPRAAAYVSHRASFLGASLRQNESSSLNRDPSHYRHPAAESEDETILERPPTRRDRGASQDLLLAQEAFRRQKEDDADDELAGNDGDDDEEDEHEDDEEDGMDVN